MTTPVSINNGPFTTNTLASKKFLLIYLFIIWFSLLTLVLQLYYFWQIFKNDVFLFLLILPLEIIVGYLILMVSSGLIAKLLLILVNSLHPPREGIFRREKQDKDYYYWSLRNVIKKWPIWLTNYIPSSMLDKCLLNLFGLNIQETTNLNGVTIDSEFISLGKNVSIGAASYIRSSMIVDKFLIIKQIRIEDEVIIGPQSYISPGTHIQQKVILEASSLTKLNQKLHRRTIYSGYPAKKVGSAMPYFNNELTIDLNNINPSKSINSKHRILEEKFEGRFTTKVPQYLLIFFVIYIFSYGLPLYALTSFMLLIFNPYYLSKPDIFSIIISSEAIYVIVFSPLIFIGLYLFNLFLVAVITKIIYVYIERNCPFQEGIYDWQEKTKEYNYYFIRSFLIRYIKWRSLKSPFPWLLAPFFNFIGNCYIGKDSVIEDLYMAKEYVWIGDNVYLGNLLLANHYWDKKLTVKGIKIESNAVISDGCCIGPGAYVQNDVTVLPLSITTKSDVMKANKLYYNTPIQEMEKSKIEDFFDLNSRKGKNHLEFKDNLIKTAFEVSNSK
ncbi:MAG: DapH/DapD/GlmU-related protein [Promethearchaeia archaeon]